MAGIERQRGLSHRQILCHLRLLGFALGCSVASPGCRFRRQSSRAALSRKSAASPSVAQREVGLAHSRESLVVMRVQLQGQPELLQPLPRRPDSRSIGRPRHDSAGSGGVSAPVAKARPALRPSPPAHQIPEKFQPRIHPAAHTASGLSSHTGTLSVLITLGVRVFSHACG